MICYTLTITDDIEGDTMYISIDFNSDEAIYQQLCNQIILAIATEQLQEGEYLPSVRELADTIGINMHTVNKAYTLLRSQGYLQVDRRRGALVCIDMNQMQATLELRDKMRVMLAQAICKNVAKEDVHQIVDDIYNEYKKGLT